MKVIINGEEKTFDSSMSIMQLFDLLQLDSQKVAVERNLEIIPFTDYERTVINDNDRIEIVAFIGGG